jgi:hypothetical protein
MSSTVDDIPHRERGGFPTKKFAGIFGGVILLKSLIGKGGLSDLKQHKSSMSVFEN